MKLRKQHAFVLYALIQYLKNVNRAFKDQPLEASVSKIRFIKLLKGSQIIDKSERGLYKNLEILEKKKLINYENKFLKLTQKGLKKAKEIEEEIDPYIDLITNIKQIKPGSAQAYFK